jgi:lipoyl(octanoyl) transferase
MSGILHIIRETKPIDYAETLLYMRDRAALIAEKKAPETLWLLEHNHVYTAGNTASSNDFRDTNLKVVAQEISQYANINAITEMAQHNKRLNSPIPIYFTERGGHVTYHGPGQRIVYFMLNLRNIYGEKIDIRDFIHRLRKLIAYSLKSFDVSAQDLSKNPEIGVWAEGEDLEPSKIAAIGLKVARGITYHGIAVNINTDLAYFDKIIACATQNERHISLKTIKKQDISTELFDREFLTQFFHIFPEYKEHKII